MIYCDNLSLNAVLNDTTLPLQICVIDHNCLNLFLIVHHVNDIILANEVVASQPWYFSLGVAPTDIGCFV